MIGTILVNVYGITLGIDIVTEMGYLYRLFDGSNDVKIEGLLFGSSLVYIDVKVLGSD